MLKRTEEFDRILRGGVVLALVPLLALCAGCPMPAAPGLDDAELLELDTPGNASIDAATALPLGETNEIEFLGTIEGPTDIDVYDLGVLAPGDAVLVDIRAVSGDLDPVAAIFDAEESLIAFNDDRVPDSSNLNPQIDFVIAGEEGRYYLGIIAYPGYISRGDYEALVRIQRNVGRTLPSGQIVYLNWAGGSNITVPNVGTFDLEAFSAVDVGLPAARTAELKNRVEEIVADQYGAYNLTVLNSDDDARPTGDHSTVHFGGSNRRAFAISEKIDSYNGDQADDAIVFTESYIGAFGVNPTFEQTAQALGNTVAHELGHLLGLVHTHDCEDLMDSSCSNIRILAPQEFGDAPLHSSVFPFGFQSATEILEWVLGLAGF